MTSKFPKNTPKKFGKKMTLFTVLITLNSGF